VLECGFAVLGFHDLVTLALEIGANYPANVRFIVGDQDSRSHTRNDSGV
jgi:hypothetical protein